MNPLANSAWPCFRHDAQRTGRVSSFSGSINNTDTAMQPMLKWKFKADRGLFSSPILNNKGNIIFGCEDGFLYTLNPSGTLLNKLAQEGCRISSSPMLKDDAVYFGGAVLFKRSIGKNNWSDSTPASDIDSNVCYIGSSKGILYAFTLPLLDLLWKFQAGKEIFSSPAIGTDGTIYFGSHDKKFYALNSDGSKKWTFEEAKDAIRSSPAIGIDGTIYFGSDDHFLYALDSEGHRKWKFECEKSIFSSPAIGTDGTIYFGSHDKNIYAINMAGKEKWHITTGEPVLSSPVIGPDNKIYIGSDDKNLYAIYPKGTVAWKYPTDNRIISSPVIGADGTIYFGDLGGIFYAITETT